MGVYDMLDEFPHGIVVLDGNYVKHICLYPKEPTKEDCLGLIEELKTDSEHGMVGEDLSKMSFCPATGELLREAIRVFSGNNDESI